MSAFNDLDALRAVRDARFRDSVARRIGCGWVLPLAVVAAVLYIAAAVARAQDAGPPMHPPHTCDQVCVVRYCADRCVGPHRDRLMGLVECRRACERTVAEHDCWPCKEQP